ncbi:MAG: MFS transporter [Pseudomonadota bacterium]
MRALSPFFALLFSTALLVAGQGLQGALVPLRGEAEGFGSFWVGGFGSSFYLGFAIGCVAAPALVARAGHIRVFAALVGLKSGTIILHPLAIDPAVWTVLRMVTGFCLAGLYIIIESWLNERTDNSNRGLVMSIYVIINFAMLTFGQMLLITYPLESFALFTLASVLVSFAALPLALSRATQPAPLYVVRLNLRRLVSNSPVGVVATFGVGAATAAFWALGGVYASRSGLTTDQAALFLSVAVVGAAFSQWPVGRLSDKIDRRLVLVGLHVASCLAGLAVFLVQPSSLIPILLGGFAIGATVFPAYAVAVAHTYDHADPDEYVTMASGLMLVFAIGSILGPISASVLVDAMGPQGFFAFIGLVEGTLAVFVIGRLAFSTPVEEGEKEDFSLATTAPVGLVLSDGDLQDQDVDLVELQPVVFEGGEEDAENALEGDDDAPRQERADPSP